MRKARVLSTICTSLALAAPALAQMPPAGACFGRDYDAAHLARNPQQGVAGLRLWFYDSIPGQADSRSVAVQARLADQGQARAAGVGGRTLRSDLRCVDEAGAPTCWIECDGGGFTLGARADGGVDLVTEHAVIGPADGCGGAVNLAEGFRRTTYRLEARPGQCGDLAERFPVPERGCYAASADGKEVDLLLLVRDHDPDLTFPWSAGMFALRLSGDPALGAMAGSVQRVWFGCSSIDGTCSGGNADGDGPDSFVLTPADGGLELRVAGLPIYDPERDVTVDLGGELARFARLTRRPDADCAGLDAE
jgi:hypothetical protein